jgi:hypothetical protein
VDILSTLETQLLQRLQPVKQQFNVQVGELTAYSLNKAIHNHEVFVNYSNRLFEYPNFTDASLHQIVSFDIFLRFLDLRSHATAYPLLEAVFARLNKFEPDCLLVVQPFAIASERFLSDLVSEGVWVYQQVWTVQVQSC